jgi:Chaperone of endosialidase
MSNNQIAVGHITADKLSTSILGSVGSDFQIHINDVPALTVNATNLVCHKPIEVDRIVTSSTFRIDAPELEIGSPGDDLGITNTTVVLANNRTSGIVTSGIVVYGAPAVVPSTFEDPSVYRRAFEWHASDKDLFHVDGGEIVLTSAPERPQWVLSGGDLNLRGFTEDGRQCAFQLAVEDHVLCIYYNVDDGTGNIVRQLITSFAGLPIIDASSPIGTPVPGNHMYNNDFYLVINTDGSVSWRNSAGVVPVLGSNGRINVDSATIGTLTSSAVVADTLVGYIGTSNLVGAVQNHQIQSLAVGKLTGVLAASQVPTSFAALSIDELTSSQITASTVTASTFAGSLATSHLSGSIADSQLDTVSCARLTGTINAYRLPAIINPISVSGAVSASSFAGSLPASYVTGTLADSQIASVSASKVSGVLDAGALPSTLNATTVDGNLTVTGNLSIAGTQTTTNSEVTVLTGSNLVITNVGADTAMVVQQTGSGPIMTLNSDVVYVSNTGNVGIGTATPQSALDVNGNLRCSSVTGSVHASNVNAGELDSVRIPTTLRGTTFGADTTVTGTLTATSVNANIDAAKIATGTVSASRLPPVMNATHFLDGVSCNGPISAPSFTGAIASTMVTGTLAASQISGIAASQVTGTLAASQISGIAASQVTGTIAASQISGIAASQVTGTLAASQIASIAASQVTGTLAASQIATIASSQITGTLAASQISGIAASQITGTLSASTVGNSIVFVGTSGDNNANSPHTFLAERVYGGTEQSELFIYKGNDHATVTGPDRIRMLAANIVLQTYSVTQPNSTNTIEGIATTSANINTAVVIDTSGRVGIGLSTPSQALDVTGNIKVSGSFMGAIAASNITGTLVASQISGIAASNITGTLAASQISGIAASQVTGTLAASQISGIAASQVTGTLAASQISGIAASQVTGTLAASQISGIAASQVTGTLVASQIATVAASQVTGTLASSQVPSSIGATTFTGNVVVQGSLSTTGDIVAYSNVSDRRFKDNVHPYVDGLAVVSAIKPVAWTWAPHAPVDPSRIGTDEIGFIAQDVPAEFQYTVDVGDQTIFAVRYDKVVVPLISAVQELSDRVRELERRQMVTSSS